MDEIPRQPSGNRNWRVKVYLLNDAGNWDDCGAGIFETMKETKSGEELEYFKITSNDEFLKKNPPSVAPERLEKLRGGSKNENCILFLPILKDNQFEKQGGEYFNYFYNPSDSIISWIDKILEEEIAISFLDESVAKDIWRFVCFRLGRDPNEEKRNQYKDLDTLPLPTMENLEQIRNDIETKKDWMVCAILENPSFLEKLHNVFRDFEDLESEENLHVIHAIIKLLIFSEDVNLLELLLSDEYYLLVFGALEYDPEIPEPKRPKYREFLQNQSTYKKVIDFKDETILKKIRLNYRISYLKDSVITSIIDDPITNQFNPISYTTNHDILEHIMSNDFYIDELFGKLTTNLKDSIGFLYELTQIVKQMVQPDEKSEYCKVLVKKKVFSFISKAFEALYASNSFQEIEDERKNILKINLVDILVFIIQLELNVFIDFLKSSQDSKTMITGIINNLFYGDQGLQIQTGELIKYLIDTIHERKNEILDIFYDNFMPAFIDHYKKLENNERFYSFVQQFIEILIHCIRSHGYRIRHYIIHHKLLHKLYPGFNTREKSLHLALIRLIKNIALSKDDFLIKYISNNNLLDDLFDVYVKNAHKNNLINSSCLEFFEFIRKENIKKLIIELTERFRDRIKELGLERFFEKLFIKYDQITDDISKEASQEPVDMHSGNKLAISNSLSENLENNYNARELSYMEDEEYFEAEDDDEELGKSAKAVEVPTKLNGDNIIKDDQPPQQPNNQASEQQIKDSFKKIKEKIASKKMEAEEDNKFTFANKVKNRSSSSERPLTMINIQFNLPSAENNQIDQTVTPDGNSGKRPGSDLTNDEEIKDEGGVDPQKKIKF